MKKLFITLFVSVAISNVLAQGGGGCYCTIGLTSFSTTLQTSSVLIKWTSNGETGTGASYNIEKSYGGTDWFLIGTVNYQNPPNGNGSYTFTDLCGRPSFLTPLPTYFYYRLNSLSKDGISKFSNIIHTSGIPSSNGTCYTACQSSTGSISGPITLCANYPQAYTVGFTSTPVTWSFTNSPNATLTPGPLTNYASVNALSNDPSGVINLQASLSACPTPYQKSIELRVGISYSAQGSCNGLYQPWHFHVTNPDAGSNYVWSVAFLNPNSDIIISQPNSLDTYIDVKGGGGVNLTYYDNCSQTQMTEGATIYSTCHSQSFLVSPNPAQDNITIVNNIDNSSEVTSANNDNLIYAVKITDQSGVVRKSLEFKSGISSEQISISDLNPGTYYISVFDGKIWEAQPLIVNR